MAKGSIDNNFECFCVAVPPGLMNGFLLLVYVHPPQVAPFGLGGGWPGALGVNWVERAAKNNVSGEEKSADGNEKEVLGHRGTAELLPGDKFVIWTPGGGGFGAPLAP